MNIADEEDCLVGPPFDPFRHGDVLTNVMLCILMRSLTSTEFWQTIVFRVTSLTSIVWRDTFKSSEDTIAEEFVREIKNMINFNST